MPVPVGEVPPALAAYLEELERRVAGLEDPGSPANVFRCTEADLPAASSYFGSFLWVTDLNILAHSDGADWRREDTGAAI